MTRQFTTYRDGMFTLINGIIHRRYQETGDYVDYDAMKTALSQDEVGVVGLRMRQDQLTKPHSIDWLAGNNVSWFSAMISQGVSPYAMRFERKRICGRWGYKPVNKP